MQGVRQASAGILPAFGEQSGLRNTPISRISHHFFVCTNRRPDGHALPCCALRGSEAVHKAFLCELARRDYPPGVKVTETGCLTPCQCGPNVIVYPQGVWYCGVTEADVTEIFAAHVDRGAVVERLLLPGDVWV